MADTGVKRVSRSGFVLGVAVILGVTAVSLWMFSMPEGWSNADGAPSNTGTPCASDEPIATENASAGPRTLGRVDRGEIPLLRLRADTLGGEGRFGVVPPAAVTSREAVVVLDATSDRLEVLGIDGVRVGALEGWRTRFGQVLGLGVVGDTIVILSSRERERRISLIGTDSVSILARRTASRSLSAVLDAGCRLARIDGAGGAGLALFLTTPSDPSTWTSGSGAPFHREFEMRRWSFDEGLGDIVWVWRDPIPDHFVDVRYVRSSQGGADTVRTLHRIRVPWAPELQVAFGDERFYVSRAGGSVIEGYDGAGRILQRLMVPGRRRAVGELDVESQYAPIYEAVGDTTYARTLREQVLAVARELPVPDSLPMVRDLWASRDGGLAVVRADLAPKMQDGVRHLAVDVFRLDGARWGRAWVPQTIRIIGFSGTALYGLLRARSGGGSGEAGEDRTTLVRYVVVDPAGPR